MSFDIIIIGSGPAGISASLYTARAGLKTAVLGMSGGALAKADKIENYFGLDAPVSGAELIARGKAQAERLGVTVRKTQVVSLTYDTVFTIGTTEEEYTAKAVILATGVSRSAPKISGLAEHEGSGVSYCAVCDGFFFRNRKTAVIGGGEYALHEANELKRVAGNVTVLTNGEAPTADFTGFDVLTDKLVAVNGEFAVESVTFDNGSILEVSGLFIAVGMAGSTDLAKKVGAATEGNRILTDENKRTAVPGLFAAGDCTGGLLQIAKAVCDGAIAATEAIKFIRK